MSSSTGSIYDPEFDAIDFYEKQICIDETCISHYWNLGVAYLLAGREEEAQLTWFAPLSTSDEIEDLTRDLVLILEQTAKDLTQTQNLEQAWLVRQHIRLLEPDRLENILESIVLTHSMDILNSEHLIEWEVKDLLLQIENLDNINENFLANCLKALVFVRTDLSLSIIESLLRLAGEKRDRLIYRTVGTSFDIFHQENACEFAIQLAEVCNAIDPNNLGTLGVLSGFYCLNGEYDRAISTAKQCYDLSPDVFEQLFSSYLIQRAHFTAGSWEDADRRVNLHRSLVAEVIKLAPNNLRHGQTQRLIISSFFLAYLEDNPKINKILQNQLGVIYQQNIKSTDTKIEIAELSLHKKTDCLRIGYIGSTFRVHSVGWLSRWLIHHHDRESFQIFMYCLNSNKDDKFNHIWFRDKVDVSYYLNDPPQHIAAQIRADEIDILIDLDSLTFDITGFVMAYKPAPVQVSWLGWDSSGIPAIDYFIADPYVLPDDAQNYYQEKIWRLPQTYLAVDGFEVGIATLRREDLDIPNDAVIYFSSQTGYKRHPDNIRCQMQIIKSVPNSYFLIKGKSDPKIVRDFFGKIAEEEGVSLDRLRFLDDVRDEYTHRANLAIADIVLDTFPYNGATTTLETLWMGTPIVTQAGQQFAARNSYTFMLNAGITEGIAWSAEEYVEWGIKLGLDRELRYQIQGKLRSGRSTAPIWNAKQFTRDLEQAYLQMWAKYQEKQQHDLN